MAGNLLPKGEGKMENTKMLMGEIAAVAKEVTMRPHGERKKNDVGEAILARFPDLKQRLEICMEEAITEGYLPEVAQFVFFGDPGLPAFAPDKKLRRAYAIQPSKLRRAAGIDDFVMVNVYWAALQK